MLGNADHFREELDSAFDERSGPAFYEKRLDAVDSTGVVAVPQFAEDGRECYRFLRSQAVRLLVQEGQPCHCHAPSR